MIPMLPSLPTLSVAAVAIVLIVVAVTVFVAVEADVAVGVVADGGVVMAVWLLAAAG